MLIGISLGNDRFLYLASQCTQLPMIGHKIATTSVTIYLTFKVKKKVKLHLYYIKQFLCLRLLVRYQVPLYNAYQTVRALFRQVLNYNLYTGLTFFIFSKIKNIPLRMSFLKNVQQFSFFKNVASLVFKLASLPRFWILDIFIFHAKSSFLMTIGPAIYFLYNIQQIIKH